MTGALPQHLSSSAAALPGYEQIPHEMVKFKLRRRAAARALTAAAAIPTLTADIRIDLSQVSIARADARSLGSPASLLAFITRATVSALLEHPNLNASYVDDGVILWQPINLSVAVDAPSGLIAPVIRDAQSLTVVQIGEAVADLAVRARGRGIRPEDLVGGTFGLSNPGAVGPVVRAEALLIPPQIALLGLPGIQRVPMAIIDQFGAERIEIRSVIAPSLSFDHRALDGAEVIRFLVSLKQILETWPLKRYQDAAVLSTPPAGD